MRIAFYAPLKAPTHEVPSGDRRVARLLILALERAGHQVELASAFRSLDIEGDRERQRSIRDEGTRIARQLVARWDASVLDKRPELWFSYHVYYKAPDWLGPQVSAALGVPYVIAEASHAPKRAGGPWSVGHDGAMESFRAANLVFSPTREDVECLQEVVSPGCRIRPLPPFLDVEPYRVGIKNRNATRKILSDEFGLDPAVPWIIVAAMMRPGDKLSSYRMLARALANLRDLPWMLLVAGDGAARPEVAKALNQAAPGRVRLLEERGDRELAAINAACDLCVWPAINEAYGMAMLEAQAAGVAVISQAQRGVPDVVCDGHTGLLSKPGDEPAFFGLVRTLLTDKRLRMELGRNAKAFVATERSVDAAAGILAQALEDLGVGKVNQTDGGGVA